MKIFKLKVSDTHYFELTKDNFETETNLKEPWYNHDAERERHFAVCPACNNSTQVISLDEKNGIYAKHNLTITVGEQNSNTLKYCPFYSNRPSLKIDSQRNTDDPISCEIKNRLIDNFDRVIYFINVSIGIKLPQNPRKLTGILETYKNSRGWMYTGANLTNIPLVFLYQSRAQDLTGFNITNIGLRNAILNYNNKITFNDYNQLDYKNTDKYISLKISFLKHKQELDNHELTERITLRVTNENNKIIYTEDVTFDDDHFINLINSTNEKYRNYNQVQLARDILQ